MGEIMAGGFTEYPFLRYADEHMIGMFESRLRSEDLDARAKEPSSWPAALRQEYGDDRGLTATRAHRDRIAAGFRALRSALDDFNPDFVLLWCKDQPDNFVEDGVPPFCIYAYDDLEFKPHAQSARLGPTIWGEDENTLVQAKGHRAGAKYLAAGLIEQGFDATYAYKPRNAAPVATSFQSLITHLDWDRQGMPYPVVPVSLNMYGHAPMTRKGFSAEGEVDPPAPPPWRCFDLGAATARVLRDSPWRVALLAGASWSHANVTAKNNLLWPDVESDRVLFEYLKSGNFKAWRDLDAQALEESGSQEVRCWGSVTGAADAMNLKPAYLDIAESWIFNSSKVVAVFL